MFFSSIAPLQEVSSGNAENYFIGFILAAVALVLSIVLHELAHGYAALANGDKTAKYAGRLSLNPAKHFDTAGLLMLLLIRVGYAKPVPVNPNNFRRKRLGFFIVSMAGVSVNILLSFFSTMVCVLMLKLDYSGMFLDGVYLFFYYMSVYNLFLCFFNLLPLYPLDGYNVLESFTSFKNPVTRFLRNYGTMILIALFMVSVIVQWLPFPYWLNLLGVYLDFFSNLVLQIFEKFWRLIFSV